MDLITVTRKSGLQFEFAVRKHRVVSDMAVSDGGEDAAPAPVELLAGSLGACIAMMVQSYCDTHGYDGDVAVSLTVELMDDPKRVGGIVVDVEVPEGVPEAKKDVIRRVAERCVIHETLLHAPQVDIEVV